MKRVYASDMPAEMAEIAGRFDHGSFDKSLGAVGIVIQEGIARNFSRQTDSDGAPWPDRVGEDDIAHPMLIETGALLAAATGTGAGSIRRVVNGRAVEVGVDKSVEMGGIPGAAVHNFGHEFGAFKVPQREWLYATGEVLDEAAAVFAEQAEKELF